MVSIHYKKKTERDMLEGSGDLQTMVHRSWLKLDRITLIPLFSLPRRFSTGTLTLSKVIYEVPAVGEYDVLMAVVSTPSCLSIKMTESPLSILFVSYCGRSVKEYTYQS